MHPLWSAHLPDADKAEFEKYVSNSKALLDRLRELLVRKIESAEKDRIDKGGYENASWPYKQADINGYVRALHEVKQLINLEKE